MNRWSRIFVTTVIVALFGTVLAGKGAFAEDNQLLMNEAFGGSFGFAIYNAQVIVGITADSFSYEVYTPDVASSIIGEQRRCLDILRDYTQQIIDAGVAVSENDLLQYMIDATYYLQDTIDALDVFLLDTTNENAAAFEVKRQKSYNAIADLLGIERIDEGDGVAE